MTSLSRTILCLAIAAVGLASAGVAAAETPLAKSTLASPFNLPLRDAAPVSSIIAPVDLKGKKVCDIDPRLVFGTPAYQHALKACDAKPDLMRGRRDVPTFGTIGRIFH